MNKPQSVKLALFSDGSTRMRVFKFSRLKVVLIALSFLAFLAILTFTAGQLLSWRYVNIAMSDVLKENRDLHNQLSDLGGRLVEVDNRLSELAKSDDQLRIMADIPKIDQDVRQVGVGGIPIPGAGFDEKDELVRNLYFNLDKLEREIKLQQRSFTEIQRQFAEKEELLSHTPSIRPVESGYISSQFGRRTDPFTRRLTQHNGTDFSAERGVPVMAAADGTVIYNKRVHGLGKVVVIDHGFGYRTVYGHLDIFSCAKGQEVRRGQKIGEVGNTGRSTAPHLHYEVHVNGDAVDPMDFFFEGYPDMTKLE